MYYRNEIIFIEKMLLSLRAIGVDSIPFSNKQFQAGIDKMKEFLIKRLKPELYSEIALLFLRKPIQCTYDRLIDGIMDLNGRYFSVAMHNPVWETISLNKLTPDDAEKLLAYNKELIDQGDIKEAVKAFCSGAGVNYNVY